MVQGTRQFLPVEIAHGEYLFTPADRCKTPPILTSSEFPATVLPLSELMRYVEEHPPPLPTLPPPVPPPPPLRHNYLHDLESLWWLAVFFVINWTMYADDKYNNDQQHYLSASLFNQKDARYTAIRIPGYFPHKVVSELPPDLQDLGHSLEEALQVLAQAYWALEEDIESNRLHLPCEVYSPFCKTFYAISQNLLRTRDILRHDV